MADMFGNLVGMIPPVVGAGLLIYTTQAFLNPEPLHKTAKSIHEGADFDHPFKITSSAKIKSLLDTV